jgi:steroid 5-alpha reductase family enzyme
MDGSAILHLATLLAVNAAVSIVAFAILAFLCIRMKDVTVVDSFWALGMVLLAVSSLIQSPRATPRRLLLVGLCALWGFRLAGYLLWRWRTRGPDRRYVTMLGRAMSKQGWSFAEASIRLVFLIQAPLQFIVCLPVQLGQASLGSTPLGPLAVAGAALALVGVAFETIGDLQLTRFRSDPANAGKVLMTGLWRYTRHPNYFGDACVWWGIYLVAAETPLGIWALPGPILLTWTLMKWSGAPTLEYRLRKTRPDYVTYIETTSGFVPWPPSAPKAHEAEPV